MNPFGFAAARAAFRATILISTYFKGIFAKDGKRQSKSTEGEDVEEEVQVEVEGIVDWLTCHL